MTVATDPGEILSIARGERAELDVDTKRAIAKAIAASYEALRDLPSDLQGRVLVACAILLGRADDVVERLTGKVRS